MRDRLVAGVGGPFQLAECVRRARHAVEAEQVTVLGIGQVEQRVERLAREAEPTLPASEVGKVDERVGILGRIEDERPDDEEGLPDLDLALTAGDALGPDASEAITTLDRVVLVAARVLVREHLLELAGQLDAHGDPARVSSGSDRARTHW